MQEIKGYDGLYLINEDGQVFSVRSDRFISPWKTKMGYLKVNLNKNGVQKGFLVHRLLAQAFIPNPSGLKIVDHKNRIIDDNRLENLRWTDNKGNCCNAKKRNNCSSKYKGVFWDKVNKKWIACVYINGKYKNLGRYTLEEKAAQMYDKYAKEHYKDFAVFNFPSLLAKEN